MFRFAFSFSALASVLFALILAPITASAAPVTVVVTIPPEATFVKQVGGHHVAVETLIGPGANPHTFEPTPRQIAQVAEADVYFAIGLSMEKAWIERIKTANPALKVVDLSEGVKTRQMQAHHHDGEHEHQDQAIDPDPAHEHAPDKSGLILTRAHEHDPAHEHTPGHNPATKHEHEHELMRDPHIWTSPVIVNQLAKTIAATLSELDAAHEADYAANLKSFQSELSELDQTLRMELAPLKNRRFMVFHPTWGYFANAYDLQQIPIEIEGKEPGPRQLTALIEEAREHEVKLILVQPQFSQTAAKRIAKEIGGRVDTADALSADYFAGLRRLATLLATQ